MSYSYSSMTRVLLVQYKGRVRTYRNINLFGIDDCLQNFANTWGYR